MGRAARTRKAQAVGKPCFLCAQPMRAGEVTNREHIPARSYFPTAIRRQFSPNLECLQVHERCNTAIKPDEEYFIASFGPMAGDDELVGTPLLDDLRRGAIEDPRRREILEQVMREFSAVQGADGSRLKSYDAGRTANVLWKIVRGLAHLDTGGAMLIAPKTPKFVEVFPTEDSIRQAPRWLPELLQGPTLGRHGRILDYRVRTFVDFDANALQRAWQVWALLLWNRIVACVAFHVPACPCEECKSHRANPGVA